MTDTNKMRDPVREQFEGWADENWPGAKRQQLERDEFGAYKNPIYRNFWTAWQASRQAVVVELPPIPPVPEDPEDAIDDSHMDAYHAEVRMRSACVKSVEAQGLRVGVRS